MSNTMSKAIRLARGWLAEHSVTVLRISLGLVILGFGVLKYFPGDVTGRAPGHAHHRHPHLRHADLHRGGRHHDGRRSTVRIRSPGIRISPRSRCRPAMWKSSSAPL
jgi:hypothetical protein